MKNILRAYGLNIDANDPKKFFSSAVIARQEDNHSYLKPSELGFLLPTELPSDSDNYPPPSGSSEEKGNVEKKHVETKKLLEDSMASIASLRSFERTKRRELTGEKFPEPIEAAYSYKDKEGKEKEKTITFDFEILLESQRAFYLKHSIELPSDFDETMSDIWDRNEEAITQEIKVNGFDELLMIPGDLDLPTLHTKMSVGYNATYEGSNFKTGGSFAGVREEKKPRLVLVHNTANLNDAPVFGAPGIQAKDIMEENQLTLTDWLIWQRMFFDGKGEHPDDWNKKSATWLPGSTIPVDPTDPSKGFRVVDANWAPSVGRLVVSASDASDSNPFLGCRLSRSFL